MSSAPNGFFHRCNKLVFLFIAHFALAVLTTGCTRTTTVQQGFLPGIALSTSTTNVSATASSVLAGQSIMVTLTTRDQNGSIFISPTPLVVAFSATTGANIGTGSFSATVSNGDGTYTSLFSGVTAGSQPTQITALINGQPVNGTSPIVTVLPGNLSVANSYITVSSTSIVSGTTAQLTLHSVDNNGNLISTGGFTTAFNLSGGTSTGTVTSPVDNGDGTYTATFTGIHAGTPTTIGAMIAGQALTSALPVITVTPGLAHTLAVSGFPTSVTAGASNTITIAALDTHGNLATGYAGTITFSTSSNSKTLPANYTFTTGSGGDNGTHTFSGVILKSSGTQSITATDTVTNSITGTEGSIAVAAGGAQSLSVSGFPASVAAGSTSSLTVTALDAYGNTASSYSGTVSFSSTSALKSLPANYTFTTGPGEDNGSHLFLNNALDTVGSQSITATDTTINSITGSETSIIVYAATAVNLSLTGFPTSVVAGTGYSFTVTATDTYGNEATGYTGVVHFTTTSSLKSLPADYTFTSGSGRDNGAHAFTSASLNSSGTQSLTVTDTSNASLTSTESSIVVSAGNAVTLALTGFPTSAIAGATNSIVVTAHDTYGNPATGYTGTVNFSTTSTLSSLPTSYTFTSGIGSDNGVHTFAANSLNTVGTQSITVTDTTTNSITGSETGIVITNASADPTHTTITATPSTALANGTSSVTLAVALKDLYGNAVPNTSVTLTSTGTGQTITQPSGTTNSSGQISGSIVATSIGNRTISISSPSGLTTVTQTVDFTGNLGAFTIANAYPQDNQITLTWNASANASSYTVGYSSTTGVYTTTVCAATTGLSCTITGLTNGTAYYFMVTASNGISTLAASAQASAIPVAVTPTMTAPTSTAPIGALATPVSGTTFSVTGTNFQYGAVVKVDGTACTTTTYVSSTSLSCTIPNGANPTYIASVTVSVTNVDGGNASQTGALFYIGAPSMWLSASSGALNTSGTAATSGAGVATWTDLTGNGNTFTATSRPTYTVNVANSQPGLLFSGSQVMSMAATSLGNNVDGMTIITSEQFTTSTNASSDFIFTLNTTGSPRFQYAAKNNSGDKWFLSGIRADTDSSKILTSSVVPTTQIVSSASIDYVGSTLQMWLNGTSLANSSVSWASSPGPTSSTNNTGGQMGLNAKMYLSEMILYSSALSATDRSHVEEYLGAKYGVTVP